MLDLSEVLAKFRAAAAARGLRLPDRIEADGRLHRCELEHGPQGKRDGAYLLHLDGVPAGGLENFKDGRGWENWKADIGRRLTLGEEAAHRARMEAQRAEREAEAKARRDKARRKANGIWNSAKPAPDDHPYLIRKGVPSFGLRVGAWPKWREVRPGEWQEGRTPGALLVPMRSASGTLHSLQAIFADRVDGRDKDFLSHGEKAGRLHMIGEISAGLPVVVAEGYATSASIHQATGWPVAVAFDAGNLEAVARALKDAHPDAPVVVAADDDAFGHCLACAAPVQVADGDTCPSCGAPHRCRNAGLTRAREAAAAVGGTVAVPDFGDPAARWQAYLDTGAALSDFNDLHALAGLDAVRAILEAAAAPQEGGEAPQGPNAPADDSSSSPAPETAASTPESAPAGDPAPDTVPTPRPRTRKKPGKGKAAAAAPQSGELFELRDGPDGRGVYRLKVERRGEGWAEVEQFVCAPLEITHMVRDARGEGWSRLAVFPDHDGRVQKVLVEDNLLEGDGMALAKLLRDRGLHVGSNRRGLLALYMNSCRPTERARLTSRVGWHQGVTEPERWSFVLGGGHDAISAEGAECWLHQVQGSGHAQFKASGSLEDWRHHVAALAVGNSRLTFALSAGFAAALCWLHPNIPGGFHWAGGSSLGKSGLLFAAASLCGPPAYRRTWLQTGTAVEMLAAGHSDAPLLLDELKQAGNPRDVAQAAYMLSSGQGKGRGQASGGLRDTAAFSLLFQSNGEIGLTQFLQENQERAYAGQEVRFCELPADAGAGFGAWERLHDLADGARFTEELQRRAAKHYGTAYPEFVRRVVDRRDALPGQFELLRKEFEKRALSEKAGGQAIRAATRFAAVAFAGEKATEWGLTGWSRFDALNASLRIFADWLRAFGGEANQEPRRMLEGVQTWIQAHAGGRLEDWRRPSLTDTHAPRTMNRAGWKRPTRETACLHEKDQVFEYLIYPAVFRQELCEGFDARQVFHELRARGLVASGDGQNAAIKVREPGAAGTSRMVCILPAILEWSPDHDT